jgi:2-keto-4-pentenoate hydratase/2-oxohepta-3-ene-1,7-dioic acid hydratase in catechol pathway
VHRPSKIICVVVNNSGLRAPAVRYPDHPTLFLKAPSTLIGHLGAIDLPDHRLVHPEAEVALVIGRRARTSTTHRPSSSTSATPSPSSPAT